MKRAGFLFERFSSLANLERAAIRAQKGKRYRYETLRFNHVREDALIRLQEELQSGSWRPAGHRHFVIYEPKRRWISAAPYRDRLVHHALCQVIEPHLDKRLIFDCWANRRGKGSHRAVLRYQRFAGRFRYVLKMDIRQYFAAIDHRLLEDQLRRVFKDRRVLDVISSVIHGGKVPEPYQAYFPGDGLFSPHKRPKGLPIGNLTSQLWANTYLSGFDHWVKQDLGTIAYLRFVDDFLLLHDNKNVLLDWRDRVCDKLTELRLLTHPRKCVVRPTTEGIPFLGYVVWPNRIRVRGETVRRFRRRLRRRLRTRKGPNPQKSLEAWMGHVRLAGRWRELRMKNKKPSTSPSARTV